MQNFDFVQNRKVIKNDLEKNESLMKKSFCKKCMRNKTKTVKNCNFDIFEAK